MIDRIVVQNSGAELQPPILLLQIWDFVPLDLVAIRIEGGIIFRKPLVATIGGKVLLFLAPHVEVHVLQIIARVVLGLWVVQGRIELGLRCRREDSGP